MSCGVMMVIPTLLVNGEASALLTLLAGLIGTGGLGAAARFVLQRERESGRAEAYREHSTQTITDLRDENARLRKQLAQYRDNLPDPPSEETEVGR